MQRWREKEKNAGIFEEKLITFWQFMTLFSEECEKIVILNRFLAYEMWGGGRSEFLNRYSFHFHSL